MNRFVYANPRLSVGEIEIAREKGVRLYDGDLKVN